VLCGGGTLESLTRLGPLRQPDVQMPARSTELQSEEGRSQGSPIQSCLRRLCSRRARLAGGQVSIHGVLLQKSALVVRTQTGSSAALSCTSASRDCHNINGKYEVEQRINSSYCIWALTLCLQTEYIRPASKRSNLSKIGVVLDRDVGG